MIMRFAEHFQLLTPAPDSSPWGFPPLQEGGTLQGVLALMEGRGTATPSGGSALVSRLFLAGNHPLPSGTLLRREKDGALYRILPGSYCRTFPRSGPITACRAERVVRSA